MTAVVPSSTVDIGLFNNDEYIPARVGNVQKAVNAIQAKYFRNAERSTVNLNTGSNYSNAFNGSTQAQPMFYIDTQSLPIDVCDEALLQFTVTNTNGAALALSLLPAHFLVDYIEVKIGASTVERIYNYHLMIERLLCSTDSQVQINQTLENYVATSSTVYGLAPTLAAGASLTFTLNIAPFFVKCKSFLKAFRENISIQVFLTPKCWAANPVASVSASLNDLQLILNGYKFSNLVFEKVKKRYSEVNHVFNYYCPQYYPISSQALSATANTTSQITGLSGEHLACIFIMARTQSGVQETQFTFVQLSQFTLLDSGQPVFFNNVKEYALQQMASQYFPQTNMIPINKIYCLSHAADPLMAIKAGISSGTHKYNPNMSLQLMAAAAATQDLIIVGYSLGQIEINTSGTAFVTQTLK